MAIVYAQTASAAGAGAIAACSGGTVLSGTQSKSILCTFGGSPGGALTVGGSDLDVETGQACVMFEITPAAGVTWGTGNFVVRINVTTANSLITWTGTFVCRINSSNVNQATIGSLTGQTTAFSTTGVKSHTVSGSSQTPGAGDKVYIVCLFSSADKNQTFGITADQNIDTPFTAVAPTVTTQAVDAIAQTTATGHGTVTAEGDAAVSERGVCWNTSTNPTTANSKATSGTGAGAFSPSMTSLTAGTHYFVRAYAINAINTSYGSNVEFDSLPPSATYAAALDTTLDIDVTSANVKKRLRIGIENTGSGAGASAFKLRCSRNGGAYFDVTASSTYVKTTASTWFADGDDVPQIITSGTYQSDNNAAEESTGAFTLTAGLAASTKFETEIALEFISADLADNDSLDFRVTQSDGTVLDTYTNTANATITKGGGFDPATLPGVFNEMYQGGMTGRIWI